MSPPLRLIIVPRWAGHAAADFYPWLTAQLRASQPPLFAEILALDLPQPQAPTLEGWVGGVLAALGDDAERLARTVVLGHSVGCQAALRALAELPAGSAIAGLLCVAGWWAVDRPWESLRPWVDAPFAVQRARAAGGHVRVLLSDNDPFTSDHEENRRCWEERMGAVVQLARDRKHFNAPEEPAVLQALLTLTMREPLARGGWEA